MEKEDLEQKEKECIYSLHRISKFIEPSLLLFLSKGTSYGYDLIEKLKELGFHKESIDVGAVYRTLRRLESEGFVRSVWQEGKSKKKRRDYNITPQGKILLEMWAERIKERRQALSRFMKLYQQD
jgi:poly-beta-hydroxybutyrate-responsive repressor